MDARKFYMKKLSLLNNVLASIQDAKERLSDLADFEEQNAYDPDMGEFYPIGAALDEVAGEVEALIDALAPLT